MANYGIKIDLCKVQGAFIQTLTGKTATKRCLIIPVDDCDSIYLGEKGCYLNLTAFEMENPQFGETHCIKGDIPKEKRDAMTDDERRALPIIGGMRQFGTSKPQAQPKTRPEEHEFQEFGTDDDRLPF